MISEVYLQDGNKKQHNTKKKPSYAAQRLVDLGTEANAAGHKNVAQVIFLIKGDQEYPKNVKNLKKDTGAKKNNLTEACSYLIGKTVEEGVARLIVEGLREAAI